MRGSGHIEQIHRIAWDYLQATAPAGLSEDDYLRWAESRMNALMALGRLESFMESPPVAAERDPTSRRLQVASGLLRAIDEVCRVLCDTPAPAHAAAA